MHNNRTLSGLISFLILLGMLICSLLGVLSNSVPPLFEARETPGARARILDASDVLPGSREEVEALVGSPLQVIQVPPGQMEDLPGGGHNILYDTGSYSLYINFDPQGTARSLLVVDGLSAAGFKLTDWKEILQDLDLQPDQPPEGQDETLTVHTREGHTVTITALYRDGPVYKIKVLSPSP